jgi:arginyl-tRNA synthetase
MDVTNAIKENLAKLVSEEYSISVEVDNIHVERPVKESWGDYATNLSLVLGKQIQQPPIDIAKNLSYRLSELGMTHEIDKVKYPIFQKVSFEDPGFINFTLSKEFLLWQAVKPVVEDDPLPPENATGPFRGQKVLVEYTDPNPFKFFHIGHLMSNAIGESLSRLIAFNGAEVRRANYQGDVGMHIAKSIWGIFKKFGQENMTLKDLEGHSPPDRMDFLGKAYALGASAFNNDAQAQEEIKQLNTQIYMAAQELLVKEENWEPVIDYSKYIEKEPKFSYEDVRAVYNKGREWSLEDFEVLYDKLGTKFDFYFFESKVGEYGLGIVEKYQKEGVFEEDQGAVIFKGEKHGLHTRVFINSTGFPVYEAKDLGLAFMKYDIYPYDRSFIITANEVNDYFKVVLKAMEQTNPELAKKTTHIGHGVMRFKHGKMSSRTGDVVTGKTMLDDAKVAALEQMQVSESHLSTGEKEGVAEKLGVGAVKYSVLKHGITKDVVYDKDQAISITGNTGPYLQYTHARANSVLEKAGDWEANEGFFVLALEEFGSTPQEEKEVSLLRQLAHFDEAIVYAAQELSPNVICEYSFELAQRFNAFYNDISILNADNNTQKMMRLYMTKQVKAVLKVGLWLLGIEAPDSV